MRRGEGIRGPGGRLRIVIPLVVMGVAVVGFAAYADTGTLSALGWGDAVLLCPIGALTTMIASRTFVPRALASLAFAIVIALLAGRAFCGWICPISLFPQRGHEDPAPKRESSAIGGKAPVSETRLSDGHAVKPLSPDEVALLSGHASRRGRRALDSRHLMLGGALLSAAVFGFPVFCLICPIGLSFASLFLLVRAFGFGDASWSLVIAPCLLVFEVAVFRRWCRALCPVSALMGLAGFANRTFQPVVDEKKCLETTGGIPCGRCARICPEGIDPRRPQSIHEMNECTRCRMCLEACPANAMSIPLIRSRSEEGERSHGENEVEP